MKKLLILLICLCLTFSIVACNKPQDTDTDTDAGSETSDVVTDLDSDKEEKVTEYEVTVIDQDGNKIEGAKIALIDENGDYLEEEVITTNANGVASFSNDDGIFVQIDVIELPEYHTNTTGKVTLENNAKITITVTNGEPNGTLGREYNLGNEDEFEITLPAGKTVYYAMYGGSGRTFTLEGADNIEFTFDSVEYKPSEDGIITFVVPTVDASSNKRIIMLKNLDKDNDIILTGTVIAPVGSFDRPHEVTVGEKYESTFEKGSTVYYQWTATKTGLIIISSDTENNDIHMQNQSTEGTIVSERTDGKKYTTLSVTEGNVIKIMVESKSTQNYNTVEFTLNCYEGTEEDPIPLYLETVAYKIAPGKSYEFYTVSDNEETTFKVSVSASKSFEIGIRQGEEDILEPTITDGKSEFEAQSKTPFFIKNTSSEEQTITIVVSTAE